MNDTQITWDQDANALYVRFSIAEVASTISLSSSVYIDVEMAGNPVGMEILGVDSNIFAMLKEFPEKATLRDLVRNAA